MADERRDARDGVREGIRAGLGILAAFTDAIEETINEMRERGEISPDRAREAMRTAMRRAQAAFDDTRERFDFVTRREFEELRDEVAALRRKVDLNPPPDEATARTIPVEEE